MLRFDAFATIYDEIHSIHFQEIQKNNRNRFWNTDAYASRIEALNLRRNRYIYSSSSIVSAQYTYTDL